MSHDDPLVLRQHASQEWEPPALSTDLVWVDLGFSSWTRRTSPSLLAVCVSSIRKLGSSLALPLAVFVFEGAQIREWVPTNNELWPMGVFLWVLALIDLLWQAASPELAKWTPSRSKMCLSWLVFLLAAVLPFVFAIGSYGFFALRTWNMKQLAMVRGVTNEVPKPGEAVARFAMILGATATAPPPKGSLVSPYARLVEEEPEEYRPNLRRRNVAVGPRQEAVPTTFGFDDLTVLSGFGSPIGETPPPPPPPAPAPFPLPLPSAPPDPPPPPRAPPAAPTGLRLVA